MDILKTSIFTACIIGIVSSFTDIAAPEGSLKKQMKVILTMILILGIFAPFLSGGFKLDLNAADKLIDQDEYENLSENFQEMYLNRSTENIKDVITNLIEQQGIAVKKVVIDSQLDEYNSLEIKKVTVYLQNSSQSDRNKITAIISENIPQTEVEFAEEDSSGY